MSLERGSMDVGTPRGSLEAAFPSGMRSSGSLAGPVSEPAGVAMDVG
jgi:hypothetical protein